MRRRLLLLLGLIVAGVLVVAVTTPWWFGVALKRLGPRWGLTVGRYERLGYARFAAHDIDYRRGNVHVTATRVEADTPVLWLVRRFAGGPHEVVVDRWAVEAEPRTPAVAAGGTRATGWVPLRTQLERIVEQLDRWLPRARSGAGAVRWRGGSLSVASAKWSDRSLSVADFVLGRLRTDAIAAFPKDAAALRVTMRSADGTLEIESRDDQLTGSFTWWDQRATLNARFAATGWLPAEASLKADAWTIAGSRLKLGELYSRVNGNADVAWNGRQFSADVRATGQPLEGRKAPPLEIALRTRGDLASVTVEALRIALPGVNAGLSEPVTIDRRGNFQGNGARFAVEADLTKQPWFPAAGRVNGEAKLVSSVTQLPVVDFALSARDVTAEDIAISTADARGRFDWPRVVVTAATVEGREGGRLEVHGGWDFRAKEVLDAAVSGELRRDTMARWLPPRPQFDRVAVNAAASGPVASLVHAGELSADRVTWPGVKPMALAAKWQGRGPAVETFSASAATGATTLKANGSADREGIKLTQLDLTQGGEPRLKLGQPATLRWRPALQLENLHLAGPRGAIDGNLVWGATGRIAVAVRDISSSWLADLIVLPGPAWELNSLAVDSTWDRGPMNFSAVMGLGIELGGGRRAVVNLASRGDRDGVRLEALRAAEGAQSIVNATGVLPMAFTPGAASLVNIDRQAGLAVDAESVPNAAFWSELAALTGLELKEPRATAHVKGTWDRPEGDVRVQAEKIAVDPKRYSRPLPTIEALDLALSGTGDGVRLDTFSLRIEGQAVQARGRLPIAEGGWARLVKDPLVLARRDAELRLEIPDADVAVFRRFLPAFLAPKGRLHVDVNFAGGEFGGGLRLQNAATRPLGPLGVLQEVDADVRLAGRTMELRSVTAKTGGEEVRLSGSIGLPPIPVLGTTAASPADRQLRFDLAMKGENLPFVRRTGLLVRGDLDLKLATTTSGGPPTLGGRVRLRDSLFLQDLRALLPGGARSKTRRPPYFAVENPPLDAWRLDVEVEGDRFMRLRTAVFNGVASARFHLGGTLGEPFALGDAIIDEGRVRLPFVTFDVQEGRVTLTREQPFEPQLWVTGAARLYSYDVRMELSGAASAPVLTFSSTPPLEHGQILLMVMAGEAPRDEVTFTDRQRAARLGTFVGQSLLASFGDSENAARLSVSSGEKVSRQGRETYDIEYRLNDRWSLTGEYDEFDDYNAGVKWRVYSKGGRVTEEAGNGEESH
jgi:translocation and assembly module TamB